MGHLLAMHDILPELESAETRELAHHVIAVGRAVQTYRPEETFETLYRSAMYAALTHLEHVPSSIKWLEAQLHTGPSKRASRSLKSGCSTRSPATHPQ